MIDSLHPVVFLLFGSLALAFLRGVPRHVLLLLLPVLGFFNLLSFDVGTTWTYALAGYQLQILRVDKLSLLFG